MPLLDTALSFMGFKQIPDRGAKSPGSRLTSAADARNLLSQCLREDIDRSFERAVVKGCIDGNPPYDDARRKAEGRNWEANLNLMEGKAIMNRTGVPYFNLFSRVPYFADCRTAYQPTTPDYEKWSMFISLRFHNMLKRWKPGFNFNVQQTSYWMRLHGIGFAYFDKGLDWRFRSIETGNVLVPKDSPSCLDERIPYLFVRVPYRIMELWNKIKNEDAAKSVGANIEAIRNAIKYGMRGMGGQPQNGDWWAQPWEHYQRILTNCDLTASFTDGDIVNCTEMLYREYDGKISKAVFTEFPVAGEETVQKNPGSETANTQFLFADPNCYENYLDGIVPFFRNHGDGTWHSVRGYAMEAFKSLEVNNRLICRGIDRAFLNSSVPVAFANERARTQSQLQVQGMLVKLPTGGEFKPIYIQGGMEDVVLMNRIVSALRNDNLGTASPRSMSRDDGRGEQPTARQVDYTAVNESAISEGEITIYYEQLDSLYSTMFRRAADPSTSDEEAKRFQHECKEDGVPPEALQNMEYVRANRQNGYGSPEMGMMKYSRSKDLVPMLPEDGKQNWLEDAVTAEFGPEKTARYAPRQHIPDDQDWQAGVENEMFQSGRTPPVTAGQNDVIHLTSHAKDAQQVLGPMEEALANGQSDPAEMEKGLTYVQAASPNWQAHIQRLQGDPTRSQEAKMFQDQFQNIVAFSGKLYVAYKRAQRQSRLAQEQAAQATALSALDQAKVQSVQTQTALAAQKTQSSIENSRAKTVQGMAQKEAKFRQEISQSARKHAIEVPAGIVSR